MFFSKRYMILYVGHTRVVMCLFEDSRPHAIRVANSCTQLEQCCREICKEDELLEAMVLLAADSQKYDLVNGPCDKNANISIDLDGPSGYIRQAISLGDRTVLLSICLDEFTIKVFNVLRQCSIYVTAYLPVPILLKIIIDDLVGSMQIPVSGITAAVVLNDQGEALLTVMDGDIPVGTFTRLLVPDGSCNIDGMLASMESHVGQPLSSFAGVIIASDDAECRIDHNSGHLAWKMITSSSLALLVGAADMHGMLANLDRGAIVESTLMYLAVKRGGSYAVGHAKNSRELSILRSLPRVKNTLWAAALLVCALFLVPQSLTLYRGYSTFQSLHKILDGSLFAHDQLVSNLEVLNKEVEVLAQQSEAYKKIVASLNQHPFIKLRMLAALQIPNYLDIKYLRWRKYGGEFEFIIGIDVGGERLGPEGFTERCYGFIDSIGSVFSEYNMQIENRRDGTSPDSHLVITAFSVRKSS